MPPQEPPDPEQYYFNAVEHGEFPGWTKLGPGEGYEPKNKADKPSYFLNQGQPAGKNASWQARISFTVPRAGSYRVLFLGLTTVSLDKDKRWSSPWAWRIDAGKESTVDHALPAYRRFSSLKYVKNQKLNIEEVKFTSNGDVYFDLGTVKLTAGKHTFHLHILGPRPGGRYVQTVEGIVLRPKP